MEYVKTKKAPKAIGPYSQGTKSNGLLFTSGQIAINPFTNKIEYWTIEEQTAQVCINIQEICKEAGTDIDNTVKTTCFLADMNDFERFNKMYKIYFRNNPARSCVAVKSLPKGVLCEIEAIVELPKE